MKQLTPKGFIYQNYPKWAEAIDNGYDIRAEEFEWLEMMQAYAEHLEQTAWIPVSERTPLPIGKKGNGLHWLSDYVLAVNQDSSTTKVVRYDSALNRWHLEPFFTPTHWQPLPQPLIK